MKLKTFRQIKAPKSESKGNGNYKVNGKILNVKRIDNDDFVVKKGNRTMKAHVDRRIIGKQNDKLKVKYSVKIGQKKTEFTCDMKKPMDLSPSMIARVSQL